MPHIFVILVFQLERKDEATAWKEEKKNRRVRRLYNAAHCDQRYVIPAADNFYLFFYGFNVFLRRVNTKYYANNIQDCSKFLGDVMTKRHFVDVETVQGIINRLIDMPLTQIQAAVDRDLINIVNNLKKNWIFEMVASDWEVC